MIRDGRRLLARTGPAPGPAAALRISSFRWLWVGTLFSSVGQWMQQVVIGWVVYDLTGSGTLLGGVNGVRSIAMLGLGPFAGVLVDRLDIKRLMLGVSIFLMLMSAAMGLILQFGLVQIWHLFLFMFIFGIAQVLDAPLRTTLTFTLVPPAVAPNAMALNSAAMSTTRALGPAAGGALLPIIGASGTFFAQAGAYLIAAFTRYRITFPPREEVRGRGSVFANLKEGFTFVVRSRYTRSFLLLGFIPPLLLIPIFTALLPIYTKDIYSQGSGTLGLLVSAVGVGGLLGAVAIAAMGSFERRGLLQLIALLVFSASLYGFSYTISRWEGMGLMLLAGFAEQLFLLTNMTMMQLTVPDALRGRVSSLMVLGFGFSPLGALAAGVGSDFVGPQTVTRVMAGAAGALGLVLLIAAPTVRNVRLSHMLRLHEEANRAAEQPTR
jgi:MFS family permease